MQVETPSGTLRQHGFPHIIQPRGCYALIVPAWSIRFDPVLAPAILMTCVGIIPRIVPNHHADRGTFVSVGARLLADNTLYSSVWDNS
jgi:hypothetical protein